ncbi:MAG TPA: efflux RND transporter permease subunit [Candidatus Udaeobacter sp.]|nr:efflux RND transporter permease subunit [Candidatus Udaeobacter sp.]
MNSVSSEASPARTNSGEGISAPFIRRPIATVLLTAAVALAGIVAFLQLPTAPLPQVDFPTISVSATLPGASPDIMASAVAAPLERQFAHMAGLTEMTSASYLGFTTITLQFDLSRNIDGAARDVQAAINAARANLPSSLPQNPTWRKVNPADAPVLIVALTSDIYSRGQLYDAASTIMQQRLLQIEGVGQVNIGGGALPGVRVEINPTQLNNTGLSLEDVRAMLSQQNANTPKGQLSDQRTTADILANDQLFKAKEYAPLIVAYRNGAPVRLSDVAAVRDSVENIRAAGYLNGKPAIPVVIFRQPGANIIKTVDRVKAALPSLKASIPAAINMQIVLDRTTTIRASVFEVERTLVIAILLVVLVVFLFLRNGRATLIPAVVVPTSLIGTFGVMYLCGYSLDNLSLMALTISTGFVVDDAIVVIENVSRHIEQGVRPMQAALKGAREVGFTVLSISLSLVAVFTPILLMGGIVGRLFREFAVVLSTAILVSLVISLTTTPMMCARLLKARTSKKPNSGVAASLRRGAGAATQRRGYRDQFGQISENVFGWVSDCYKKSLQIVLRHPAITLGVLVATIAATLWLFVHVPKGFFPEQDNGTIFGGMQGPQDSSFQAMQAAALRVSETIKNDPAVAAVVSFVGGSGPGTAATNSGFVYAALKPLEERKISSSQVINRLRPKLAAVPGAMTFLQAGQDLRIGGRQSNAQYQYTIQSENLSDLVKWGPIMLAEMRKLHGFTDVNSDQLNAGLQAWLTYDRATAARLGISAQLIDDTLYDAFGQRQVSTMFTSLNQYHVVMEVDPQFWQNPKGLDMIYIRPTHGATVSSPGSLATSSLASSQPTPVPTPFSSQVAPAPTTGGTSASTISTPQLVPAPVAPTAPPVASPQPTDGPIAVPTPAFPFAISQAGSTPNAVASIATATPSTTLGSSSPAASSVVVTTPANTPATFQLLPTPTPFATPASAVVTSTPASNATASTPASNSTASSSGAGASPSPTPVVPLSAVAGFQPTTAPIAVNHQGQFPSVTISFNLAGGMALSAAVSEIQQMQQRIAIPGTIHGNFSGAAQAFQASLASEPFLILAALLAVYIVLGILYESYIHPITILSTLPSAGVGALLALMLFRTDLSVIAMIGLLLLIGIVKKNAILMVDFALEAERAQGMRPREAIYQACLLRFRPILMTTVAALFGALPLVLSTGVGSELRRPLGITIVGGLIFSQALTLYTTPVVYLYFDRLREWWGSRKQQTLVSPHGTLSVPDAI